MRAEIEKAEATGTRRPIEKFILAALSSIPWIGSFITAAASLKSEEETHHQNLSADAVGGGAPTEADRIR